MVGKTDTTEQIETLSSFEKLAKINVNDHAEKKGKFTYLSWAWAVDVLRKAEPTATWEVKRFDGLPFLKTELGYFVEVAVTVQGMTLSQLHPVLDSYNKPISKPDAFQINTSIQRALVKAIALHGLGLYIYAGEDLPESEEETKEEPKNAFGFSKNLTKGIDEDMKDTLRKKNEEEFDLVKLAIMGLGSETELQAAWESKKKEIASLRKYAQDLYAELVAIGAREKNRITGE